MTKPAERRISVGRVVGLFGVNGWVKVYSHTRPREAILNYRPWHVTVGGATRTLDMLEGRPQGKGLVARLGGCDDRDAAALLVGAEIAVDASQLPATGEREYYWADLEGLRVVNHVGIELGRVSHLFETGANDVMVVRGERERLIPFCSPVVQDVDLEAETIRVDWDDED
ncbi:MAG TPA: ribosome maturation factor RimM [Burkholderiales bacterium]